jgi:tetratricopeptide (TPR) repeat protein
MATISAALAIAVQHHQAGRLQAAEEIYRQVLRAEPNQADAIHLLGVIEQQRGKPEIAAEYIQRAIGLNGDVAAFHNNLGEAYRALRRFSEAVASFRRAVELKPDYAEAYYNLGNAWKDQEKLEEAVACYGRALELKPEYAAAYNNLGNAWKDLENLDKAVDCYRQALAWKPDFAEAHDNLGNALTATGALHSAEDCFRAALRHNPRFAPAHCHLAELLRGKLPQPDLAAQRRLLEEAGLTDAHRLLLHFGLAQVLDARGEYAEAAEHMERGNALQRSEWRKCGQEYDPVEHERLVTRMIEVCTPEFFQRVHGFGLESELPVFVVGLPRSGTTLVEQILASHSQVFGAGEIKLARESMLALGERGADFLDGLRRLDQEAAHRLASQHLDRLRALDGAALRIVDKMPDNYLSLGLLATLFPRAKFIRCRRDLRDVAVSCWMTRFQEIRWASDQQHIASRFRQYQRIMEHWRQVLPVSLLEVNYEETVADPEGAARKLVDWCGLAWEPCCLEFQQAKRPVQTASAVQVRQPIFRTSVGKWRHYEPYLSSLFARLEK